MRQLWQCENCGFIAPDDKICALHEGHCEEYKAGDKVEIRTHRADAVMNVSDRWERAIVRSADPAEFSGKRTLYVRLEDLPAAAAYRWANVGSEIRKVGQ
jgi:hypothetical protein